MVNLAILAAVLFGGASVLGMPVIGPRAISEWSERDTAYSGDIRLYARGRDKTDAQRKQDRDSKRKNRLSLSADPEELKRFVERQKGYSKKYQLSLKKDPEKRARRLTGEKESRARARKAKKAAAKAKGTTPQSTEPSQPPLSPPQFPTPGPSTAAARNSRAPTPEFPAPSSPPTPSAFVSPGPSSATVARSSPPPSPLAVPYTGPEPSDVLYVNLGLNVFHHWYRERRHG